MTTVLTRVPERTTTVPDQDVPDQTASDQMALDQGVPDLTAPLPEPPVRPAPLAHPAAEPRIVLTGSLTRADGAELEPRLTRLVATSAPVVEVDLSRVERLDPHAARLLLRASWRLGDPARRLVLLHPRPQALRVLSFVGAGHLVER